MYVKYRFWVNGVITHPIYKDDVSLEYTKESKQRFLRAGLSGTLKFIGSDFDYIQSQPFETEFLLFIEKSNDNGLTWADYHPGVFYKTDCTIDADNNTIEAKINIKDQYTEVLAKMEDEYDLIKLAAEKTRVSIEKRPLLQIYHPGDSVVSCFLGGNVWEQDVIEPTTDIGLITNTYNFGLASTLHKWEVTNTPYGYGTIQGSPLFCVGDYVKNSQGDFIGRNGVYGISELWSGNTMRYLIHPDSFVKTSEDIGSVYIDSNSHKWIIYLASSEFENIGVLAYKHTFELPSSGTLTWEYGGINHSSINYDIYENRSGSGYYTRIYRISDSTTMFRSIQYLSPLIYDAEAPLMPYHDSARGYLNAFYKQPSEYYARFLISAKSMFGVEAPMLTDDDLVAYNRNYERAFVYNIDCIVANNNASESATKYGIAPDELYYESPNSPTDIFYPILKSTWGYSSLWLSYESLDQSQETEGRKVYIMNDAVLISDAIKILLAQIDPTISHDGTSEYSNFLYSGDNPITHGDFKLAITQKSNILIGEYGLPAQKAPITLKNILDMLQACYQCYWCIIDNKLIIEHVTWFKSGGTYGVNPLISFNASTSYHRKNNKPWDYGTLRYSFDKYEMPELFSFSWMDECTESFDGYPIKINSKFVTRGRKEEINVSQFSSDVDYMLLNPEAFSKEGFALLTLVDNNLFDPYDPDNTDGYLLASTGGGVFAHASYNTSEYIRVKEEVYYYFTSVARVAFYNSSKTWISSVNFSELQNTKILSPNNAYYLRVSTDTLNWYTMHVIEGEVFIKWKLPYYAYDINGINFLIQNGYASWVYLHSNFWNWDLPSDDVMINDSVFSWVYGIDRRKNQKIVAPFLDDPDPLNLIKTALGNGQIEKLSINLQSRMADIQLKYDTFEL
jgi:hypothetical protein